MQYWEKLASAKVPGSGEEISLHRRGHEYHIKVDGHLLMDNMVHASEEALATIACRKLEGLRSPVVLVGGLGMGFTLAAALAELGPGAKVVVAELVPAVIEWNRGPISHLAGHPLRDPRVKVVLRDVAQLLKAERGAFDALLMDVDNGTEGLTAKVNDRLYSDPGLEAAAASLRPGGILAFWSAKPDKIFVKRLRRLGFEVEEHPVRGHKGRGAHYMVYTARR
jgi:spermidine synthase